MKSEVRKRALTVVEEIFHEAARFAQRHSAAPRRLP